MKTKRHAVTLFKGITIAVALNLTPAPTLWANSMQGAAPSRPSMGAVQSAYGHLPLSFEANQGQTDPHVQFMTRGRGQQLFLTPSEAVLTLRTSEAKGEGRERDATHRTPSSSPSAPSQSVVRMTLKGANPQAEVVGLDQLPGIVNYFIGDDPSKWRTHIPTYQKVKYKNLYDGIDLVYYGNQGQLEYDLVVAPGADPAQITLAFDGAEQIEVDQYGDLVLTLMQSSTDAVGRNIPTLRLHKPVVYQMDDHGEKHLLAGTYLLLTAETEPSRSASIVVPPTETTHVAFQIATYDGSKPLVIDPVLSWATYLGGSSEEIGAGVAIDQRGNAYVTGRTDGPGFPIIAGTLQSTSGLFSDAFVTKLNAAGTALVYSTYLGGSGVDEGFGIDVDQAGNAYVTGDTSGGFPGTAGSLIQSTFGGANDAFVTKLNAAGTALVYSTYLGGSGVDFGHGIAVDQAGDAYVIGSTFSPGSSLPGTGSSLIQSTYAGGGDAFVTKLNAAGTAILYSTYLGGSGDEFGSGIAVDAAGNAYVTGSTTTPGSGFPGTAGSLIQSTSGSGSGHLGSDDAFVTKLNAAGMAIVYSTYLGGSGTDEGRGIAVDLLGNAYVTGSTTTTSGFPGTGGSLIQSVYGGSTDGFVTKLNAAGTALVYSTYLGGSGFDFANGIAVDLVGQAHVIGRTQTAGSGFPGTAGSLIQSTFGGGIHDAFVTKLNAAGTAIAYSTYLGGSGDEFGFGIAVDQAGNAYVTGSTLTPGSGFPGTAGSLVQSTFGGGIDWGDAFVAKISTNTSPTCGAARAVPALLWSPNHQFVPIAVAGVIDPDGNAVTITVTGVTQDEPVNAKGDGNTSPDAVIQAGTASVRAERSGNGNGRVYQLSFRADDGHGGVCTGAVKVGVPHSQKKGVTAIDDGQIYDSTIR